MHKKTYLCAQIALKRIMPKTMEAITKKIRTPEEIVAWFNAARQRKAAWEKETKAELKSFVEESRRAKESHYFEFAV